MIVFLTLLYVAVLAVLVRKGIITLNLWWKLSPLAWMLFLLIVLFIPMQWGAPAGQVVMVQKTVEVVPNVAGEVVEVPVKPLTPLKKGDVLFCIDPEPFQVEVDRLSAALVEAEQKAKMLPQNLASAEAAVSQAEARLIEAKQEAEALRVELEAAAAAVTKAKADSRLAEANLVRESGLAERAPGTISEQELDVRRAQASSAAAAVETAIAREKQAKLAYQSQLEGVNTTVISAEEALNAAMAARQNAKLALESTINGENTTVAQLRAQLAAAKIDLDDTIVRAPNDGFVIGVTLRPGQRVVSTPLRTWMAFVETEENRLVVGVNHYALRNIEIGQKAEVVLNVHPGKVFSGTVEGTGPITPEGQVGPSGDIPQAPGELARSPFPVTLKLDDEVAEMNEIPGGSIGTAAIYTDSARATHIVRRVMIRMDSWMNYLVP